MWKHYLDWHTGTQIALCLCLFSKRRKKPSLSPLSRVTPKAAGVSVHADTVGVSQAEVSIYCRWLERGPVNDVKIPVW